MSFSELKNNVCRICLDENVVLNWSNTLVKCYHMSYKDCYYKYTQLKPLDDDPFSSMLCQNCLHGLENVHALILKALDSHKFLLEVNCMNSDIEKTIIVEDGVNCSIDFETILLEKSAIYENYAHESFDEISIEEKEAQFQGICLKNEREDIDKSLQINNKDGVSKSMNSLYTKSAIGDSRKDGTNCYDNNFKTLKTNHTYHIKVPNKKSGNDIDDKNKNTSTLKRGKAKRKQEHTPSMCSFCSKILHSKYALQKHEKTHATNRERKAPCPICGVKFFTESHVRLHMKIHNDNRVKKHKCEFCDKAFFEKGDLNVHRRMHLGQMVPCTICSKEFCRQVDLEIHMNSHSAKLIAGVKKKSKYWVHCKYCDKDIKSTNFRSHTAVHLNEPLMKCSICDKEFFLRNSCREHVKTIHKKRTDYKEFIILYQKNRLSHLYLEQTAEIRLDEDL